jgi:hypothetical protein
VACDRQQGHTRITCLCMQAHWVWSEALSAGGARWDGARWPHQGAWIGLLGARAYPPVWVVRLRSVYLVWMIDHPINHPE